MYKPNERVHTSNDQLLMSSSNNHHHINRSLWKAHHHHHHHHLSFVQTTILQCWLLVVVAAFGGGIQLSNGFATIPATPLSYNSILPHYRTQHHPHSNVRHYHYAPYHKVHPVPLVHTITRLCLSNEPTNGQSSTTSPPPSPPSSSSTPTKVQFIPRLLLLDRDGVINYDVGSPGVLHTSQLQLLPNAAHAIGNVVRRRRDDNNNNNCNIALITNQSCVGKGLLTSHGLQTIHNQLQVLLQTEDSDAVLDSLYCCTSTAPAPRYSSATTVATTNELEDDPRRKPNPGMIYEACADYDCYAPHRECVVVGDTIGDLQAAAAAGVLVRVLVETGYGLGIMDGWRVPRDGCGVVIVVGEGDES